MELRFLRPEAPTGPNLVFDLRIHDGFIIPVTYDNAELVTNGDFADWTTPGTPDGWSVIGESGNDPEVDECATGEAHADTPTLGGGMCNIYTSDSTSILIQQDFVAIIGRRYRVSINIDTVTTGTINVVEVAQTNWSTKNYNSSGTKTFTFVATATALRLRIARGAACDVTIDDVSIKQVNEIASRDGNFTGELLGTTPVMSFPGVDLPAVDEYIDVGTGPTSVNTVLLWVKPDAINVTDSPIDLNGTDFLTIVNGTLTKNGFAGGTAVLYTNGVAAGTTITAGKWYLIGITDTVAKDATDLDIGREGANYFNGFIDAVRLYSRVLTTQEIRSIYEVQKWRYGV